jgi:enoyl-CoA hydratase/carnithine racemase
MNFSTLLLNQEGAVLRVTIKNDPINLMNMTMIQELFQLSGMLITDPNTKVVVFDSANPDFFIAHVDLEELATSLNDPAHASKYPDINALQSLTLTYRNLPQITIAKIDGCVRGGGLEFALGLSMRFASTNSTFGFPEASGGIMAGGSGTTALAYAAGPAKALEILLTSRDFSGEEAERYNLINRALPAGELDAYIDDVVERISLRSAAVIGAHHEVFKQAFSAMVEPMFDAYAAENEGIKMGVATKEAQVMMEHHIKIGQTKENEINLANTIHDFRKTLTDEDLKD